MENKEEEIALNINIDITDGKLSNVQISSKEEESEVDENEEIDENEEDTKQLPPRKYRPLPALPISKLTQNELEISEEEINLQQEIKENSILGDMVS